MQNQAPVSFEIEVNKATITPTPEVIKRLGAADRKPLTRQLIEER